MIMREEMTKTSDGNTAAVTVKRRLTTTDHDSRSAGMAYVYAVISRRAGGVSIGVNLNPNDACNWRCIYCQVPGLVRGKGPKLDLPLLERELRTMLEDVVHGDFMSRLVPEGSRVLRDIALSGNGEPTTSPDIGEVIELIGRVLEEMSLQATVDKILISNGSMLDKPAVIAAIRRHAELGGVLWFKLDTVTEDGLRFINGASGKPAAHLRRLRRVASLCPTWIQTCLFAVDGKPPSETDQRAYLDAVRSVVQDAVPLRGVLLYTIARPSMQLEAPRLAALPEAWLRDFARRVEDIGLPVRVSV
jgi:wyosine [tRNA(Phe)-imidazoG37] synthetase (radical SAM superfamily)